MATDRNQMTSLMAMDQSAAFDCVSSEILIRKLKVYKCSQGTLEWMTSYLSNRSQYVSMGRHVSRTLPIYRGVPQGSILGPLLYIIYTNELAETVVEDFCTKPEHKDNSTLFNRQCQNCGLIVKYADDITFLTSNKIRANNQMKMNLNLAIIESFLFSYLFPCVFSSPSLYHLFSLTSFYSCSLLHACFSQ